MIPLGFDLVLFIFAFVILVYIFLGLCAIVFGVSLIIEEKRKRK